MFLLILEADLVIADISLLNAKSSTSSAYGMLSAAGTLC